MPIALILSALLVLAPPEGSVRRDSVVIADAPFAMPAIALPAIPSARFDIRDYGAVEGGIVKNTSAFHRAISAAARKGGGHIIVPAGKWLTGAIHLESHIDLHLERGAELLFSQDPNDYLPVVFSRHEDTECYKYSAFVYADEKTDIAVTGEGVLNGQGKPWWAWKTERKALEASLIAMGNRGVPVKERVFDGKDGRGLRPAFFQPMRCKNVLVEGVTFLYGAFWTITPTYCDNVVVRNVKVETSGAYGHTPNGDGVDPSSCRNVLIEDCDFSTGDDCIAIKAGRDADGMRVNIPTENVVVRRVTGHQGHGGIVIGSETSGGIRNIYAHDCKFSGTDRIIRIKTQRGRGGVLENMWFRSMSGDSILMEGIHVNMLYTGDRLPAQKVTAATPRIRNLHFSKIVQTSGLGPAVEILGIPEMPVRGVSFDSLTMTSATGMHIVDADSIFVTDSRIVPLKGPVVRIDHSRDVLLTGMESPALRDPFLWIDGTDVRGIVLRGMHGPGTPVLIHTPPGLPADAVRVDPDPSQPWSARIADSFLSRHPGAVTYDSVFTQRTWNYEQGVMLVALDRMWHFTGNAKYFQFVKENLDQYVRNDGSIATYARTDYNLDNIGPGRALLALYAATGEMKYRRAADTLREQLREQPRTAEGGFWHKKIYPYQMWLDGLFMAEPFYAQYSEMFHDTAAIADIVKQFRLVTAHTRDARTGLLYHGYDERRMQRWADKTTGCSPCFWARSIGWYAMGLVEVLDILPEGTPGREDLLTMLRQTARAVADMQDPVTGVWYQVIDQPRREGNYREASASAMFTYVFARGVARGYLDRSYADRAKKAFQGILQNFVVVGLDGLVNLLHTCKGAGLGGTPYRDGSYEYYISEPQRVNDLKGIAPFLLAAIELEQMERTQ